MAADRIIAFDQLPLPAAIVERLRTCGMAVPLPIQAATLPAALAGRDVFGLAGPGAGRTLAFGLPMAARLAGGRAAPRRPLALVLTPTRELAQQVTAALHPYADAGRLRCVTAVGGPSLRAQVVALRRGVEVLVATPGRLTDLIARGECRLDQVEVTVVDGADQLAEAGLLLQVGALLEQVPASGQRMLYSAAPDHAVDRLVRRFLLDPVLHCADPPAPARAGQSHHLLEVRSEDKQETVAEIAAREQRVIMFVHTKRGADRLVRQLVDRGVSAAALHGGKSQGQRTRVLEQFRAGAVHALVATNVTTRGIRVDDLDLVVNVDPPADGRDYLHRGGRTGRDGRGGGAVVTLVLPHQRREVSRLMVAAGLRPACATVGPGHPDLVRVTGARPGAAGRLPEPVG